MQRLDTKYKDIKRYYQFLKFKRDLRASSLLKLKLHEIILLLTTSVVIVFFKGQDRKGIPAILYEIARNSSLVSHVKMYSQIIQSAITVGLGGSAGLESPIAVTGSAIRSNFAKTLLTEPLPEGPVGEAWLLSDRVGPSLVAGGSLTGKTITG